MKRVLLTILILNLFNLLSCNGKDIKKIKPLGQNETTVTEYDFKRNLLNVYYNNGISENLLLSKKLTWGCWQFSEDKTKIIFWEYIKDSKQIYLIDFKDGIYKTVNVPYKDFVMSRNFKYYVVPEKKDKQLNFYLYNFENNKKICNIIWKLKNENYAIDSVYYLSVSNVLYQNYDFEAYVGTDGSCCAIGLFGIDCNYVETIYEYSEGDDETVAEKVEKSISKDYIDRRIN